MVPMVSPSSPEAALVLNLGHGLPICLCVMLPLCVYVHKSCRCTFACLTANSETQFLNPCGFPSKSVRKHGVPRSFWWRRGLLSVPSPCHYHPSWCLPRSSRGRYSRGGSADSQTAQLPAGLACASLYSKACRVLHSTAEESGPPHSHPSSLWLDFSISPNRWWGLTLIFSLSSRVTSMPCTSLCFWISSWERIFKFCLILWTPPPVYSLLLSFLWGAFCPREDIKFCFVQIDLFFFFFPNHDFLKREVSKNIS